MFCPRAEYQGREQKNTEIDASDSSLAVLYQFYFKTDMGFIRFSTGKRGGSSSLAVLFLTLYDIQSV